MSLLSKRSVASAVQLLGSFLIATFAISNSVAHITLSPKFGEPGQNLTTAFHVPHGCNGSSTIGILVTVPQENITNVAPQQLSNWTLHTTYTDDTNTTVKTIEWSGGVLKATDALDFPIVLSLSQVQLPSSEANVTLYFPVHQSCEIGASDWNVTDGSKEGEPAPTLMIVKNATQAAADSIAIKHGNNSSTSSSSGASSIPTVASSATVSTSNILYVAFASCIAAFIQTCVI